MDTNKFRAFELYIEVIRLGGANIVSLIEYLHIDPSNHYAFEPTFFQAYFKESLTSGLLSLDSEDARKKCEQLLIHLEKHVGNTAKDIHPNYGNLEYTQGFTSEIDSLSNYILSKESILNFYSEATDFLKSFIKSRTNPEEQIRKGVNDGLPESMEKLVWTRRTDLFFALISVLTEEPDPLSKEKPCIIVNGNKSSDKTKTRKLIGKLIQVPKESNAGEFYKPGSIAKNLDLTAPYFKENNARLELKDQIRTFLDNLS